MKRECVPILRKHSISFRTIVDLKRSENNADGKFDGPMEFVMRR